MTAEPDRKLLTVLARATVHLNGLAPGDIVPVNPEKPYIAELLAAGYLVKVGEVE